MKRIFWATALIGIVGVCLSAYAAKPAGFDDLSSQTLRAMEKRANELHITGVAVVAFAEGAKRFPSRA